MGTQSMQALTREYLEQCPVEDGFRLRGMAMTRIEVFVDAAFAFAVTLLVISVNDIPRSYAERVDALKGVPAFIAAVAQLVWIWHAHSTWSRRFGLEDAVTVVLSASLLMVVLVYIFPLRVMMQGMFSWITGDWLPTPFTLQSLEQLRFMFLFMGVGFAMLCLLFTLMYAWARRRADDLLLSDQERFETATLGGIWLGSGVIGLVSVVLAVTMPEGVGGFAGVGFSVRWAWLRWVSGLRARRKLVLFPA
jgi:hypothetical protein